MSSERMEFTKDSRPICKYGTECFRKNPDHHKIYKHPPQINKKDSVKQKNHRFKPYSNEGKTEKNEKKEDQSAGTSNKKESDAEKSPSTSKPVEEICHISIKLPENLSYYTKNSDYLLLKELFLVEMPQDFYNFFYFLNEDEQDVEKVLASVNLELIGPYDYLLGKLPILDDKELYLIHWRFFFDPPEFQAVLKKKGESQYHIGYYRDRPDDKPEFLASNDSEKDYIITPMAENIFATTYLYLQNEIKRSPFISIACQQFMDKIKRFADENGYSLDEYDRTKRQSKMITATFHRAGIIVPYNKKTQLGYRPLVETDVNLKKLFKNLETAATQSEKDTILSELQPVITNANIAMDEFDFGTGLEVAIDLFCSGLKELQACALNAFNVAYTLLNREAFSKIIKAHLKYRRRGPNLSLLSLCEK